MRAERLLLRVFIDYFHRADEQHGARELPGAVVTYPYVVFGVDYEERKERGEKGQKNDRERKENGQKKGRDGREKVERKEKERGEKGEKRKRKAGDRNLFQNLCKMYTDGFLMGSDRLMRQFFEKCRSFCSGFNNFVWAFSREKGERKQTA